jgi:hypothetical protein
VLLLFDHVVEKIVLPLIRLLLQILTVPFLLPLPSDGCCSFLVESQIGLRDLSRFVFLFYVHFALVTTLFSPKEDQVTCLAYFLLFSYFLHCYFSFGYVIGKSIFFSMF